MVKVSLANLIQCILFLITIPRYMIETTKERKGLHLLYISEAQSIEMGKSWRQEFGTANQIVSMFGKQRKVNDSVQLTFLF